MAHQQHNHATNFNSLQLQPMSYIIFAVHDKTYIT